MTYLGDAYAVATAIYAGTRSEPIVDIEDLSDRLYRTLAGTALGSDEAKADLYAQLAETLTATTPFDHAVDIIAAAMQNTHKALH